MSVFAGLPGRLVGKQRSSVVSAGGVASAIDDWHKCVKHLTVSSRDNQAPNLIEGHDGYWQSAGNQGKVCLCACAFLVSATVG